jgi:hypothetical protein
VPKAIQSDQGSKFMPGMFQQVLILVCYSVTALDTFTQGVSSEAYLDFDFLQAMHELGFRQYKSTAYMYMYHPKSRGHLNVSIKLLKNP